MKTVAIVGCGKHMGGMEGFGIAYAHADAWRSLGEDVCLLGVDINTENLAAFGTHYELAESQLFCSTEDLYRMNVPDYVSICTWPGLHADMVVAAAEQGVKGIVCEKPMALNMADIARMVQSCRDHHVKLLIAHQRRYNPYFVMARDLIKEGRIGAPHVLEARVEQGWDILSWTTHWFDLANYLFDDTPLWVLAGADVTGVRRYNHPVENASVVIVQYPNDQQALFITGPVNPHTQAITLRGETGMLRLFEDRSAQLYTCDGYMELTPATPQNNTDDVSNYGSGFVPLVQDLVATVEQGDVSRCDVSYCRAATEMALAAHESIRTRKQIHLPLQVAFSPLEVLTHVPTPTLHGLHTLLYVDDHFGSGGREGIAEALQAMTGHAPTVLDAATHHLCAEDLTGIDLICLYHTQEDATALTRAALVNWVEAGKPLLILHAALGAYPEWETYTQWLGYVWKWGVSSHPYAPMQLTVTDGDPLGFGWQTAWLPQDEVYVDLDMVSETIDGMTTDLPAGRFPVAWVSSQYPNVGAWMPGHRYDSWQVPTMRAGVAALMAVLVKTAIKE